CVELFEYMIRALVLDQSRNRPRLVRRVAECDGARGARFRARGREFVGTQRSVVLELGAMLRAANALDAHGALLHDTLAAHRDVGIELPVERLGKRVLRPMWLAVTKPVEVANLVGTVVGAVTSSHAPVVDLNVESVRSVIRRVHRADGLARRVTAVLAHHRDEARLEIGAAVFPALVIALESDPRHLATACDVRAEARAVRQYLRRLPVGADSRNVVLGVARGYACSASGASRQVDRHGPASLGH